MRRSEPTFIKHTHPLCCWYLEPANVYKL